MKLTKGTVFRSNTGRAYIVRDIVDGFVTADGYQMDFEGNIVVEKGAPKLEKGAVLGGPIELVEAFASQV